MKPRACTPQEGARKRGDGMPKKHIANHFADWMKRIGERLSDLESNYKDLDSRHEELSEKVEDLEGELADADSRIDDLESEVR
jgi:archaellum component FlaC